MEKHRKIDFFSPNRLNEWGAVLVVILTLSGLLGCQSTSEPKNASMTEQEVTQKILELKSEMRQEISFTIRNEILPELREIQLASRRNQSRKQVKIRKNSKAKIIIGRVEWIKLLSPEIPIRARIDTGAQTCSLHAEKIIEKEVDGVRYVEFTTLDERAKPHRIVKKIIEETRVKSTSGKSEKRFVVEMNILFGRRNLTVAVNLNDRKSLKHRFLVGRNLLLGDYIVDVSQSRVLGKKP